MDTPNSSTEVSSTTSTTVVESYKIFIVEPTTVPAGMQLISFRRKTTTQNPVAEANKFRCAIVPKYRSHQWETVVQPESAAEVFSAVLEDAVNAAAGNILLDYWQANQQTVDSIPAALVSFPAVLAKMQLAQTSQRLTSDQIKAWYDASKTSADAAIRYGSDDVAKKKAAALREKFLSLASNNPAVMPALATKMLSYINVEDSEHSVCKAIAKRLDRLQQVSVSADDL